MPAPSIEDRSLLLTITGEDRPGVSARLFQAVAGPQVRVLDVEQAVVRGNLVLTVLLGLPETDLARATAAAEELGAALAMTITWRQGRGDNRQRPSGRFAVTVLGAPISASAVAGVASMISGRNANIDRIYRLARTPVTALQFDVSGIGDGDGFRRALVRDVAELGIDVAVSPAGLARRGRRLVVIDVDSTLIQDEVIELLAARAGRRPEVAKLTEAAMRGELDFAQSLHQRVEVLAGMDADVIDDVRALVRLTPGAKTLCRTLLGLGYTLALVSGGFTEVVQPLAASLGVSHVRANHLEVVDGRLTGRVVGPVIDRAAKAAALLEFAAAEGLPLSRTVAIGDGANDLDMLAVAGLGIAFNAKPLVQQQAQTRVNVPYLDSVLYLLGISRDEVLEAGLAEDD